MEQLLSLYRASGDNISPVIFVDLINRSLASSGIYALGEFYDILHSRVEESPNLKADPLVGKHLSLLEIFVYRTWKDYSSKSKLLPPLTEPQIKKLKQLTLATLGASANVLKFDTIAEEIEVPRTEIEKFLIDCIYDEVCIGLIDSENHRFEVRSVIARDASPQRLEEIESILDERIKLISQIIHQNQSSSLLSKEKAGLRNQQVRDYRTSFVDSLRQISNSQKGPS